jgi:cysteine desulfurase/selenocysteine lyase
VDIRSDFPIFQHYPELTYLDSAATSQKPRHVLDAERDFYERFNANVHRGIYPIAAAATRAYETSRQTVQKFIHAALPEEIIFTSGTTDATNLVAQSFALDRLQAGDNILITGMEHHANLIPWQQVCQKKGARLLVVPFDRAGILEMSILKTYLSPKTKLVAVTHISNTLGTINPVAEIIALARQSGIPVFVDAAQSAAAYPIDVQAWDVDFLAFSGHKLFGPTGIGVLYGKKEWLDALPPYRFGGSMIRDVRFERTIFAGLPSKFEAGTPNMAGAIGLAAAINYIESIGRPAIQNHIHALRDYAAHKLSAIRELEVIGQAREKTGIFSFILSKRTPLEEKREIHPHDIATILGQQNICVRAGHHCTQPIMDFYDIPATTRASFSIYNDFADIDKLVKGIEGILAMGF